MDAMDGVKHLAMDGNVAELQDDMLGESAAEGLGESSNMDFDEEIDDKQESTDEKAKAKCEDINPALCVHKATAGLCDDTSLAPEHLNLVHTQCPKTCGRCEVGESDCKEPEACEGYKSKCGNLRVKNICKKSCGACGSRA